MDEKYIYMYILKIKGSVQWPIGVAPHLESGTGFSQSGEKEKEKSQYGTQLLIKPGEHEPQHCEVHGVSTNCNVFPTESTLPVSPRGWSRRGQHFLGVRQDATAGPVGGAAASEKVPPEACESGRGACPSEPPPPLYPSPEVREQQRRSS